MSRGRACSICVDPNRAQIDALILSGVRLKDIVAQVGNLSVYSLSRHKKHLAPVPDAPTGDGVSLESQIAVWLQRSEDLYLAGGASLDLRTQAQAITSAFRALEAAQKMREHAAEQEAKEDITTGTDSILTIGALDALIAKADSDPRRAPIFAIRCALQRVDDRSFPALCAATLDFIKTFRMPESLTAVPELITKETASA